MSESIESVDTGSDEGFEASEGVELEESDFQEEEESDGWDKKEEPEEEEDDQEEESEDEKPKAKKKAAPKKELSEDMDDHIVRVKIDGEEKVMTFKELKKVHSLEQASQKRFETAAERERKALSLVKMAVERPEEFLAKTGRDPAEIAEAILRQRIQEAEMTPEQKQLRQLQKEHEQSQGELDTIRFREAKQQLDSEIVEAFQESGLPNDRFLVSRMASVMQASLRRAKAGQGEPLSAKQAAGIVKKWYESNIGSSLQNLTPDKLLASLGKDKAAELRKYLVSQVTAAPTRNSNSRPDTRSVTNSDKKQKPMNEREWRAYVDNL